LAAIGKHPYDVAVIRRKLFLPLVLVATAAAAPVTAVPPQDYTQLSTGKLLDFRYSFPTVVGSDARLLAAIHADRTARFTEALTAAREDAAMRRPQAFPFHRHEFWRDWSIPGQTDRLMSLRSQTETFTGGAHGMHITGLKLWDKKRAAAISFASLFSSPGYWPLLQARFCAALQKERLRRVQMKLESCPKASDLVLIPADTDANWILDTIEIVADPYVAGSYAEGRYEIRLPVTTALVAALKPEYRSSFEVQRVQ
jgi:hypothetical protein